MNLKQNWGWIALAGFLGLLIYLLFRSQPAPVDYSTDKHSVDSLVKIIEAARAQHARDSAAYAIDADVAQGKLDSMDFVSKQLTAQTKELKEQIDAMGSTILVDTNITVCHAALGAVIRQRDSLFNIASTIELFQGQRDEYFNSLITEANQHAHRSDSLFVWSTAVAVAIANKYDTLYKEHTHTAAQLKTSRTMVKAGAGLLIVAAGVITGLLIK